MPNRIIRDWTDSISFDGISPEAERLFTRLIMKADDFGRFHADPRLVRAGCFPLVESLRTNDVTRWLDELSTRKLILRYEADQRNVLAIVNYGQRLKLSKAKFPPFPGEDTEWLPTSRNFPELPARNRNEVETETEVETKAKTPDGGGEEVVKAWNAEAKLPPVQHLTDKRKTALKARLSESYFRDNYATGIKKAARSAFLTGNSDGGWKATFDWFVKPDSLPRIMEGKYDGRAATATLPLRAGEEPPIFDPGTE